MLSMPCPLSVLFLPCVHPLQVRRGLPRLLSEHASALDSPTSAIEKACGHRQPCSAPPLSTTGTRKKGAVTLCSSATHATHTHAHGHNRTRSAATFPQLTTARYLPSSRTAQSLLSFPLLIQRAPREAVG
ncbi:hypothetical protein J3F83DRAFT_755469 [Trichoderma novae-zelandiae]